METKIPPSITPNPFAPAYQPKVKEDLPLHLKWSRAGEDKPAKATDPSRNVGLDCTGDPGLADQSQAAEADVNFIMDRYLKTGVRPEMREGLYGDFSDVPSYHEAMNIVSHAQQQFAQLDAKTRQRFMNDPAQFLGFVAEASRDPKKVQELIEMGLADPRSESDTDRLIGAIRAANSPPPADSAPAAGSRSQKSEK